MAQVLPLEVGLNYRKLCQVVRCCVSRVSKDKAFSCIVSVPTTLPVVSTERAI